MRWFFFCAFLSFPFLCNFCFLFNSLPFLFLSNLIISLSLSLITNTQIGASSKSQETNIWSIFCHQALPPASFTLLTHKNIYTTNYFRSAELFIWRVNKKKKKNIKPEELEVYISSARRSNQARKREKKEMMTPAANMGAGQFGDTTYTKVFVGGLAWETQKETMEKYFEQFGEILEAVVITDKATGRSKGYGFVCSSFSFLIFLHFLSFIFCFRYIHMYIYMCMMIFVFNTRSWSKWKI